MKIFSIIISLLAVSLNLFSQSPQFEWVSVVNTTYGSGNDKSIVIDSLGNVYTTGSFIGTTDFDPGTEEQNVTANSSSDIYILKLNSSGSFVWVKTFGGNSAESGMSLDIDELGNIYLTGFYKKTVDFDPGSGVFNLTSIGHEDIFVLKLNSNGDFLWAKSFGGYGYIDLGRADIGNSLIVDNIGNIVITGHFEDVVDFDPGSGVHNITSNGLTDVFILKLTTYGDFVWVESFGGIHYDTGNSIVTDNIGNIYVTGYFMDIIEFDPVFGLDDIVSNGKSDVFISKLDPAGSILWVSKMGRTWDDMPGSIVVYPKGDIFIAGYSHNPDTIWSEIDTTFAVVSGNNDIFISKIDSSGQFDWTKYIGGNCSGYCFSISLDNDENIYATGFFKDTMSFGLNSTIPDITSNGQKDVFILKMDSYSEVIWAANIGGGSSDHASSIIVDDENNIFITGIVSFNVDFDPGNGCTSISCPGGSKFILKLNQSLESIIFPVEMDTLINIYPNPANSIITIEFAETIRNGIIELVNISGKIVLKQQFKDQQSIELDIRELPIGEYFIRVINANDTLAVKQFVKL